MTTIIFIDAGYITACNRPHLDLLRLSNELDNNRKKSIVYDASTSRLDGSPNTSAFHDKIKKLDKFELQLGRLLKADNGRTRQKGVDMMLGVDLVEMSLKKEINKAILISADSDFKYAVERAQAHKVNVMLAHFKNSRINNEFLNQFDSRIEIGPDLIRKCQLR